MRPSAILEANRAAVREAVSRYFGSVLHGTDKEGGDIDILVDKLPGATLFDLGGLLEELQAILGTDIDLLTPGDLPKKFRDKVIAEAKPI